MNVLDLFSGIGGFSLGLERAGFKTVAFCEIEPFCRSVLRKHWPDVQQYEDIRTLTAERLAADGIRCDVICGGFPCQDISNAGKRAGIEGERSGLWSEYARLIGELRPRYVIVENVAALLGRGMGRVLGDLAALGYDAEWEIISAADVGAPHLRERVWIVGYPNNNGPHATENGISVAEGIYGNAQRQNELGEFARSGEQRAQDVAHTNSARLRKQDIFMQQPRGTEIIGASKDVANSNDNQRRDVSGIERFSKKQHVSGKRGALQEFTDTNISGLEGSHDNCESSKRVYFSTSELCKDVGNAECCWWSTEPDVGRVANGVPARVDRLKGLGNAVVPQIPEIIGNAIMQAEGLK